MGADTLRELPQSRFTMDQVALLLSSSEEDTEVREVSSTPSQRTKTLLLSPVLPPPTITKRRRRRMRTLTHQLLEPELSERSDVLLREPPLLLMPLETRLVELQ